MNTADIVALKEKREYNRRYYRENKEKWTRYAAAVEERRQRNMDILAAVRDFCVCEECGSSDRLHFHHRDPSTKKFEMANSSARSVKTVMDELAKCAVLCIRCHMRLHMTLNNPRRRST